MPWGIAQVLLAGAFGFGWDVGGAAFPKLGMAGIALGQVIAYSGCALFLLWYLTSGPARVPINAILIDRRSYGYEVPKTVIGCFSRHRGKINRQIVHHLLAEIGYGRPHILPRKWIVSGVIAKVYKLFFDVGANRRAWRGDRGTTGA
jgi:hypothetical protein